MTEPRVLPFEEQAERQVLGQMLVSSDVLYRALDMVRVEHFHVAEYKLIYGAIVELSKKGFAVDPMTVTQHLKDQDAERFSYLGASMVTDLAADIATTTSYEYWSKKLVDLAARRGLIRACNEAIAKAYDDTLEVDKLMETTQQKLCDVADQNKSDAPKSVGVILRAARNQIKEQEETGVIPGCPTGFKDLDAELVSLKPGELWVLAGATGMGKSALASQIGERNALTGRVVALFSSEMSEEQMARRILSVNSDVFFQKLKEAHLTLLDWERLDDTIKRFETVPMFVQEAAGWSLHDIASHCRRIKVEQKRLDLVIVDYLQQVSTPRGNNRNDEIGVITRGLKLLAMQLKVPILALSQLNRQLAARQEKRPTLSDLRDSGSIEQDSDVVAFVYRDEYYHKDTTAKGEAEVIIAKNRSGSQATIKLVFQASTTRFFDYQQEVDYVRTRAANQRYRQDSIYVGGDN